MCSTTSDLFHEQEIRKEELDRYRRCVLVLTALSLCDHSEGGSLYHVLVWTPSPAGLWKRVQNQKRQTHDRMCELSTGPTNIQLNWQWR